MKTYTIKQPTFELHTDEDGDKSWCVYNTEEHIYIYFEPDNSLPYRARYCFDEYYNEGSKEFNTFGEAEEWLVGKYNKYVARNLDEVSNGNRLNHQARDNYENIYD